MHACIFIQTNIYISTYTHIHPRVTPWKGRCLRHGRLQKRLDHYPNTHRFRILGQGPSFLPKSHIGVAAGSINTGRSRLQARAWPWQDIPLFIRGLCTGQYCSWHSTSPLLQPPPNCILQWLLRNICPPPCFAVQQTRLVMSISCKGQARTKPA